MKAPPLPRQWTGARLSPCALKRASLPVLGGRFGRLRCLTHGGSGGFTWLTPQLCPPTRMPGQRCGHPRPKCAKSIQSRDKKNIYIQLGWHPGLGPGSFPHSGTGCLLCEGQQGPVEAIRARQSPGLETWGPWSSTGRGTGGAHVGLAEGPGGLVLWHLGPTACCQASQKQPP